MGDVKVGVCITLHFRLQNFCLFCFMESFQVIIRIKIMYLGVQVFACTRQSTCMTLTRGAFNIVSACAAALECFLSEHEPLPVLERYVSLVL